MKISQNQYFDFAFVCGSGRAEDGCGEDGYGGRSGGHGDDGGLEVVLVVVIPLVCK